MTEVYVTRGHSNAKKYHNEPDCMYLNIAKKTRNRQCGYNGDQEHYREIPMEQAELRDLTVCAACEDSDERE